jgi:hypothetical protein
LDGESEGLLLVSPSYVSWQVWRLENFLWSSASDDYQHPEAGIGAETLSSRAAEKAKHIDGSAVISARITALQLHHLSRGNV